MAGEAPMALDAGSDYSCADVKLGELETPEKWSIAAGRCAMDGRDLGRAQMGS